MPLGLPSFNKISAPKPRASEELVQAVTEKVKEEKGESHDGDEVGRIALGEVMQEVAIRLKEEGEYSSEKAIKILLALLAEYGAVHPGTTIPLNNAHQYRAEIAAKMLTQVKAEKEFADIMKRTKLPANDNVPQTVAANDNLPNAIAVNDNAPQTVAANENAPHAIAA